MLFDQLVNGLSLTVCLFVFFHHLDFFFHNDVSHKALLRKWQICLLYCMITKKLGSRLSNLVTSLAFSMRPEAVACGLLFVVDFIQKLF